LQIFSTNSPFLFETAGVIATHAKRTLMNRRIAGGTLRGSASRHNEGGASCRSKVRAQSRYCEANKNNLERQGVDVKEWDQPSKALKLAERATGIKKRLANHRSESS
jgi:hypothetical protein